MFAKARGLSQVPRKVAVLGLILAVVGVIAGGLLIANAFEDAYTSGVSPAPDVHKFRTVPASPGAVEDEYCAHCHDVEAQALEDYPHATGAGLSQCLYCHQVRGPDHWGHAASVARCVDCHAAEAQEMAQATAAHDGLYVQLGEDENTASWVCKACHTHHPVEIAEILAADQVEAVPLDIDEIDVPWE